MIGEKDCRRKGIAGSALKLAHDFIKNQLKKSVVQAKINKDNTASIQFFQKYGYSVVREIKPFDQIELHITL